MIIEQFKKNTVTTVFILPVLKIGRKKLDNVGFLDAFMFNGEEQMVYDNCIHLLFCPVSMDKFTDFLQDERDRGASIVDENDYAGGLVLLTYKIPARFETDIQKIWLGKYSEVSQEYRNMIPSTAKKEVDGVIVTFTSAQHMVFNKDPSLRKKLEQELAVEIDPKQEIWTKPSIERETFKLKNYEHTAIDA